MPETPATAKTPDAPSRHRDRWIFELSADQVVRFEAALGERGIKAQRLSEQVTRHFQSQVVETRVNGTIERETNFADFTMEGVPVVTDGRGELVNPSGYILTIRTLLSPQEEPGVQLLAEEIAAAFPGTLVMSPESLNQTLSRMHWWKNVAGIGCFTLGLVIVFGVLALAFYGAAKLFF